MKLNVNFGIVQISWNHFIQTLHFYLNFKSSEFSKKHIFTSVSMLEKQHFLNLPLLEILLQAMSLQSY